MPVVSALPPALQYMHLFLSLSKCIRFFFFGLGILLSTTLDAIQQQFNALQAQVQAGALPTAAYVPLQAVETITPGHNGHHKDEECCYSHRIEVQSLCS